MKIHYIMHAEFEKPGIIETWAIENGHHLSGTHTYRGDKLPAVIDFDLLVVMGGPQSPLEIDRYPYLLDEIFFIWAAIKEGKGVIGICLGAQLIGEALGAKTLKSPYKEVGMYPIMLNEEAASDPVFINFPHAFPVMHWHNDMPGISLESVLLARSEGCPHQAFRFGDRVYGLQFHLEPSRAMIQEMIKHCSSDLQTSEYTQTAEELLSADFESINSKMIVFLNYLKNVLCPVNDSIY